MPADRDRVLRPYEVAERAIRAIDRAATILWELAYLDEGDFMGIDLHGVSIANNRLSDACAAYALKHSKAWNDPEPAPPVDITCTATTDRKTLAG